LSPDPAQTGPVSEQPTPRSGPDAAGPGRLATADGLTLLNEGVIDVVGRLVDASNATLYCAVESGGVRRTCVYKPIAGERPLWDFPDGTLAAREVAAYLVSSATGWDLVPPTVMRDGPYGQGMCQLWVDVDESVDLTRLARSDHLDLRRMAVLDVVLNNADRKGGHLLPTADGRVFGVDHGVCFSVQGKLRTLLWQWRGDPLTEEAVTVLDCLRQDLDAGLGEQLGGLLTGAEVRATRRRVDRLLRTGVHPEPSGEWPPIPWPPF
jgi:Phosphatidylinositol 3- and 4-kinase